MMITRPQIMGVLNVTPDSFSDGGKFDRIGSAVDRAFEMVDQGADIIDIGGESTRPGADIVNQDAELKRVIPVIEALNKNKIKADISIDTRRPRIAAEAVNAGASIWNDVTALSFDKNSINVAAGLGCKLILMHMRGDPKTMQNRPEYDHVVTEVKAYLSARIDACVAGGIKKQNIAIDPGLGFGKRLQDNLDLLQSFDDFYDLGCSVLIGASRKSFINKIDGSPVDKRLGGSLAAALWAASLGASIIRVHDVQETAQALKVWQAIRERENA